MFDLNKFLVPLDKYDIDEDEEDIIYEQIQPTLSKRGKIIFDVPKDLEGLIEISDSIIWSDEKKYVSWA